MQVIVANLLTTYAVTGSGSKTIVMAHGWADTHKTFAALQAELSETYKVISLDLPGSGGTEAPSEAWSLDEYAEFLGAFLAKLHIPKPYAFVGHSNGGAIIIRGLATQKLDAERLVLLAAAGVRDIGTTRKKMLKVVAKTGKLLSAPLPKPIRERMRRKLYKIVQSDLLVAEHLAETFKRVVDQDIQADAASLQVPTLLIYGQDDTVTPPVYGRLLNGRIEGSELKIIAGAGHFVHHDQPTKALAFIETFLSA